MNGNRLLLDTNIILYLLNGDETLIDILEGKHVYISFITALELYGFKQLTTAEKIKIDSVLASRTVIDVNTGIKDKTIEIKQNFNIKLTDSLIAGTAIYFDIPLITADTDFNKINSLNVLNYMK